MLKVLVLASLATCLSALILAGVQKDTPALMDLRSNMSKIEENSNFIYSKPYIIGSAKPIPIPDCWIDNMVRVEEIYTSPETKKNKYECIDVKQKKSSLR